MTEDTPERGQREPGETPSHLAPARHDVGSLVLASIRDAVAVTDADGRITLWNRGAESLFGLDADRVLGREVLDLLSIHDVPGAAPLMAAVEAGAYWTGDLVMLGSEGDRIIDVVTYPIADAQPDAARVYICWDVTLERQTAHADAHLAAVVEQAEDAILTVDRDWVVLSWNRGAERLLGIPAEAAIGKVVPFVATDDVRDDLRHQVLDLGEAVQLREERLRAADGTEIPVSLTATPVREADGQVRRLSIIARDERPRVEAEREIRLRDAILDNTDDAVLTIDDARHVTFWSRGAERLFGVSASAALGALAEEVMSPRPLDPAVKGAWKRLARGEVIRTDFEFRRADGSMFIGEVTANKVHAMQDGAQNYLAIVRDATEQRRAARDSARLAAIVESAADIIFSADERMVIRSWNPGAERALGYRAAEIVGRTIATIVAPDRLPEAMIQRDTILRGAPSVAGELTYIARDGTRIPVWVSHAPVVEGTSVVAVSTIAQDLRGRKSAEEQLRQAQKLEAVGRLAAGIAHDFSNLLTAVTGYATLLLADLGADDPAAGNARQILQAAERAGDLTRSLLALSSGRSREPKVLEVDELVAGLEETLRRLLPDGVELRITTGSGIRINVDPTDLELALVNLVTNAGEATPKGGHVDLLTRGTALDEAFAATHLGVQPGPHVEVVVRDTGRGLSAEARARLFEPLFTTKAPGPGAGMGLATVHASVERAGGTVWVDPAGPSGTTFRIYLPAVPGTTGVLAPARAVRHAPRGGTERILIVEDDTQVRALATTILARAGYVLTVKGDPRRALEVDTGSVDLLLTDVIMPHLDGPSLAAEMLGRRPDLQVLFMSGFTDGNGARDLARLSSHPLLTKPFGPVELLEAVRAALDERPDAPR
jgi:two-component system, cell cycle sensor histidine kinase and response regulator CckA